LFDSDDIPPATAGDFADHPFITICRDDKPKGLSADK
jgi:hypothetical protein